MHFRSLPSESLMEGTAMLMHSAKKKCVYVRCEWNLTACIKLRYPCVCEKNTSSEIEVRLYASNVLPSWGQKGKLWASLCSDRDHTFRNKLSLPGFHALYLYFVKDFTFHILRFKCSWYRHYMTSVSSPSNSLSRWSWLRIRKGFRWMLPAFS